MASTAMAGDIPEALSDYLAHVVLAGTGQAADPTKWAFAPKGEFKSLCDLEEWSKTLDGNVALYYNNEFPHVRFSANVLEPALWEMFWIQTDVAREGTVFKYHLVVRGRHHMCGEGGGLPIQKEVTIHEEPRNEFGITARRKYGKCGGMDLATLLPVLSGSGHDLLQFLQLKAVKPEVKQFSLIFNTFKWAQDYIVREFGLPQDLKRCCKELNVGVPSVAASMTSEERKKYRALTALFLLGPAYTGMYRLRQEVFEKAKAACAEIGEDFLDSRSFNDLIGQVGYSCEERRGRLSEVLGRLLARNKSNEYEPKVKQDDLIDVDAQDLGLDAYSKALLKQAREAYAYASCTTLHWAIVAKKLKGELIEKAYPKSYPSWKSEMELLASVANRIEESPFAGLRWHLPDQQTVARWPRLALIGLEYRVANAKNTGESSYLAKQKTKVANLVRNRSLGDEQVCAILATMIPRGPEGKKVMLEGASLGVAQTIMREESESSRREILGMLTKAGITCPWRTYQEGLVQRNKRKGEEQ